MILRWNSLGLLPPIRPNVPGNNPDRSPYHVTMSDLLEKFAFSEERRRILRGLLNYRETLYKAGISQGFQWINGSFTENIEMLENRAPNDVDIVTFFYLPSGISEREFLERFSELFEPKKIKVKYQVDGYMHQLGQPLESRHARQIVYWYSMWSHKRDGTWKGFLQIDLSRDEDALASNVLGLRGDL